MSPTTPIRVAIWSPAGAGLHYHGPGQAIHRLYQSDMMARFNGELVHGSANQESSAAFAKIHKIGSFDGTRSSQLRYLWPSYKWIKSNARMFDVFQGVNAYAITVQAARWAERAGLPAIIRVTAHKSDLESHSNLSRIARAGKRRQTQLRQLSGVVALSNAIWNELLDYGVDDSRIFRISNAVDCTRYRPANVTERSALRQQLNLPDRHTIVFCGALVTRKRPHLLLNAMSDSQLKRLNPMILFVGPESEPNYAAEFKKLVKSLGLEDSVITTGHVANVEDYLRASDIFVLPSLNEGMSSALLEGMASGLACIATPISGTADVIEHGRNGWILNSDCKDLPQAIAAYLKDDKMRLTHGAGARALMLNTHDIPKVLDAYANMYKRVTS